MNRLVLIDGNAILHRAYHALPPLTAPDGTIVNAVYGFASMLVKIVNDFQPTYLAVAFDRPTPTFRKEMFKAYQAKRPKMDEELVPQIAKVHEMLQAFGVAVYERDGFEADDVIGTLAKEAIRDTRHVIRKPKNSSDVSHLPARLDSAERAGEAGLTSHISPDIDQVIIVTGDRDILQLVQDEKVFAFMPTKGLSEGKLYGEAEVKERMGVEPKKIPDLKALAGDQSDNYPGVAGVGPKTAVELLDQFGSVEKLFKAVKRKDPKIKETLLSKLEQGAESAEMSHQLATIKTDVPLAINWEQMKISSLAKPEAIKFFETLHFSSLIKRLTGKSELPKSESKATKKKVKEPDTNQQALF